MAADAFSTAGGGQGVDAGQAQVFKQPDLSFIDKEMERQRQERARKEAERQRHMGDLNKGLAGLNHLDIDPQDINPITSQAKTVRDFVTQHGQEIYKDPYGSKAAEANELISTITNDALRSKNKRELKEQHIAKITNEAGGYENLDQEQKDILQKWATPYKEGEKIDFDISKDLPTAYSRTPTSLEIAKAFKENAGKPIQVQTSEKNADGSISNRLTETYTPQEVRNTADLLWSKPSFTKAADKAYKAAPKEIQDKYITVGPDGNEVADVHKFYTEEKLVPKYAITTKNIKNEKAAPQNRNYEGGANEKVINGAIWNNYKDEETGQSTVTASNPKAKGTIGFEGVYDASGNKVDAVEFSATQPFTMIKDPGAKSYTIHAEKKNPLYGKKDPATGDVYKVPEFEKFTIPYTPHNSQKIENIFHSNPEAISQELSSGGEKAKAAPIAGVRTTQARPISVTSAQADEAAKKHNMSRVDYLKAMKKAGHTIVITD